MVSGVSKSIASGAAWMVGLKFVERALGFISTLILARLLMPEDFGLVAMAMAVYGFIEMGGQFGFDINLIRQNNPTDSHFNSAWTMSVAYGAFTALLMILMSETVAAYFSDGRLVAIMMFLGMLAFVQGFENVGIVNFRRKLDFEKDFRFQILRKISSFVITIIFAYYTKSYWALLIGMGVNRIVGVFLSYRMHPFRPKFDTSEIKSAMRYSKWILLRGFVDFGINRGPDFFIGKIFNGAGLGVYKVAHEIATLPTTELLYPIMRAVYPGYAAVQSDRSLLARYFLMVQGIIITVALPAGLGIVVLAEPFVFVLLGERWMDAVPLVKILGLYGAVTVFQATNNSIFNVLNKPKWGALIKIFEMFFLLIAIFLFFNYGFGLKGVAFAGLVGAIMVMPIGVLMVNKLLPITAIDRLVVAWRPVVSTILMYIVVDWFVNQFDHVQNKKIGDYIFIMLIGVPLGVFVYSVFLIFSWYLCGKPDGLEKRFIGFSANLIFRLKLKLWRFL